MKTNNNKTLMNCTPTVLHRRYNLFEIPFSIIQRYFYPECRAKKAIKNQK